MAEKLALKKALMNELKETNRRIEEMKKIKFESSQHSDINSHQQFLRADIEIVSLKYHKDFIQRLIDICVDRNKF